MLCGERWMRCTVRNKWWRIKIEKDKERHNTETQRHRDHREELGRRPPRGSGAFCFVRKKKGAPTGSERPYVN